MSSDVEIQGWLTGLGYGAGVAQQGARAVLEELQLTRPGKVRISAAKLERGAAVLGERFSLHCTSPACLAAARTSGREPLPAATRAHCAHCGGSDNARAARALAVACASAGVRRILVVGGSPSVREELHAGLGDRVELRTVDGTERRTQERARSDLDWADLVLLWGGTELDHKVSTHYAHPAAPLRRKVVHVARRGIAALLDAATEHLRRNP